METNEDAIPTEEERRMRLAQKLWNFLGTHAVEQWVSPNGYKLIKVTRCAKCEQVKELAS